MKGKLRILDYFVHGGAQYEFFKTGHDFYLVGLDSQKPMWDPNNRPFLPNVKFITEQDACKKRFDVVMVRSPLNIKRYERFVRQGSKPVAVVQTTSPYPLLKQVKHVVWNSHQTMKTFQGQFRDKQHHFIVHGFDPKEFLNLELEKQNRVLTVANVFKKRADIMGFDLWNKVNSKLQNCDIVGHGNTDISKDICEAKDFKELVKIYNSYAVFFNPTRESAMPRSRGEALMCGSAVVSTKNYDIDSFFTHNKDILFADSYKEATESISRLLESKALREDIGLRARETAIKCFNLQDYLDKWNSLFEKL